jgi:hypothetical protein
LWVAIFLVEMGYVSKFNTELGFLKFAVSRPYQRDAFAGRRRLGARRRSVRPCTLERLEERSLLSTITVTNTDDTGPGTLRAAIEQADLDSSHDAIVFAPSVTGNIALSSALPDLSGNIDIVGPGSSDLTVARSAAPGTAGFRIFNIPVGAVIAISGLTVTGGSVTVAGSDGKASGGGIENSGTLFLDDVTISGNTAGAVFTFLEGVAGEGGGIDNSGMLSINDTTISNNRAVGLEAAPGEGEGGFGGGIHNSGTLAITNATLTGNSGFAGSGGIENSGTLLVADSAFASNSGGGSGGGAIGNSGDATVSGSTFTNNDSANGGAGIKNSGTLSLSNSTFSDNISYNNIGAAITNFGTMSISASTFSRNSNQGGGGAIGNLGNMSVAASTFTGNTAVSATSFPGIPNPGDGGAIDNSGTLSVVNSTFSGNSTQGGSGGAIADSGTLSLTFVTIAGNSARGPKCTGGGVAIMNGTNTKVETIDSIFDNRKGGNISGGTRRNFQSLGHNLFSDKPRVRLRSSDLIKTHPRLGPLADNGGPTLTRIPLRGSRAIGAGVPIVTVSSDQRGFPRSQRNATDIGAVEVPFLRRW